MSSAQLRLKHPSGWFAAGREVESALALLSDPAFKLFVWLCLHADRARGALEASPADLARSFDKGENEIRAGLDELVAKGVCQRVQNTILQVADRFWPYERGEGARPSDDRLRYLEQIKRTFLDRRCVRSAFTAADEKLATELYRTGVPLQNVERAIFLGCLRKYTSLVNNGAGTPITTLHYFTGLIEEVGRIQVSVDYWRYIEYKVRQVERRWSNAIPTAAKEETK